MRTITVKGTGNVSARPDYIILSLNIEVLSETYDRAMLEAAERIERLQGAAVRVGYRKEDRRPRALMSRQGTRMSRIGKEITSESLPDMLAAIA